MAELILTSHWTGGDVLPFVKIGAYLSRIGHRVTLVTHCIYKTMALENGIKFIPWDTIEEYEKFMTDMGNYTDEVSKKEEILKFRDKYENAAVKYKEYEILRKLCEKKENIIIIAKDRSEAAAMLLSEQYQIPLIQVFINPFETCSMQVFNDVFRERACQEANDLRAMVGAAEISDWLEWQSSPRMQVALWPEWFSFEENEWPVPLHKLGFPIQRLYKNEKSAGFHVIKNYIKDNSELIIITGGTSLQINREFYRSAVNACGRLKIQTIVITKYRELLPEELPDNVIWFETVDLDGVMPYATLVVNHGGIGTISGAIYAGVPQLVMGHNVDRPLNGAIISRLGLGKFLPLCAWEPEVIASNILELIQGDYKERCMSFFHTNLAVEVSFFQKLNDIVGEAEGKKSYAVKYISRKKSKRKNDEEGEKEINKVIKKDEKALTHEMEQIPAYLKNILMKKLEERKNLDTK